MQAGKRVIAKQQREETASSCDERQPLCLAVFAIFPSNPSILRGLKVRGCGSEGAGLNSLGTAKKTGKSGP